MAQLAEAIADHPTPPMGERMRILAKMGEDAPRFRAADRKVHEHAKELAVAAEQEDMLQVLHFYHRLMQGCVDCYSEFRPRVVD